MRAVILVTCLSLLGSADFASSKTIKKHHKAVPGKVTSKNGNNNGNNNKNGNSNSNVNTNDVTVKINLANNKNGKNRSRSRASQSVLGNGLLDSQGFSGNGSGGNNSSPPSYSSSPYTNYAPVIEGVPGAGAVGGLASNLAPPLPTLNNNADDPNTAWLTVEVPHDQADVYLNDVKQAQKGAVRKYVTPPLDPTQTYNYSLKVVWPNGSGKLSYNANIELKAGDEIYHIVPKDKVPMPKKVVAPVPAAAQEKVLEDNLSQKIRFAKDLLENGKIVKAKERLEDILQKHPGTKAADDAKAILAKVK